MTLSINDTQGVSITKICNEFHYAKCHYAERCVSFIVMLNAVMLRVVAPVGLLTLAPWTRQKTNKSNLVCSSYVQGITHSKRLKFVLNLAKLT
jgi:hypothetical protein